MVNDPSVDVNHFILDFISQNLQKRSFRDLNEAVEAAKI